MRICRTCEREYKPSSGHLDCPVCRNKIMVKPCPVCGELMQARSNVCIDCLLARSGKDSNSWKGGKHKSQKGYVRLYTDDGYVLEHRLVMENSIGRKLHSYETVHHLNGVKDDNRIENLELWTKPQPSGIRHSDAVVWAREILAREDRARAEFDHMRGLAFV